MCFLAKVAYFLEKQAYFQYYVIGKMLLDFWNVNNFKPFEFVMFMQFKIDEGMYFLREACEDLKHDFAAKSVWSWAKYLNTGLWFSGVK